MELARGIIRYSFVGRSMGESDYLYSYEYGISAQSHLPGASTHEPVSREPRARSQDLPVPAYSYSTYRLKLRSSSQQVHKPSSSRNHSSFRIVTSRYFALCCKQLAREATTRKPSANLCPSRSRVVVGCFPPVFYWYGGQKASVMS
eukprot:scaffold353159_cov29-Prasinocladus_malaysianus.AAC.1